MLDRNISLEKLFSKERWAIILVIFQIPSLSLLFLKFNYDY